MNEVYGNPTLTELADFFDKHGEELAALMDFVRVVKGQYVEVRNAHFITDKANTPAIITVDSGFTAGWQWPIQVTNPESGVPDPVKCLGCDELSEHGHVLCETCKETLKMFRNLDPAVVDSVVDVFTDPALKGFFQLLTVDNFKKYMEDQIGTV